MQPARRVDVVVVGAGLSGLVCAWRIHQAGLDVVCLEASDRVGGALRTHRREGFVAEGGASTVQETPPLMDLVRELDFEDQVRRTAPKLSRFIYRHGVLHRLPQSLAAMFGTTVVSQAGKLRILGEMAVRSARQQGGGEETVAGFVTRRFGVEALAALVSPLVSGTFAGDPEKLAVAAVFPRLVELEQKSGSVLRGFLAGGGGDPERRTNGSLVSFRAGMASLPERIAERLADRLSLETRVVALSGGAGSYQVTTVGGSVTASAVVLAVPAWIAAELVSTLAPEAAAPLAEIEAPRLACVSVSWPLSQLGHALDGLGFLVAPGEGVRILGCLWPSSMFEERAPGGAALLTCFVGGARDPAAAALDDRALVAAVVADLAKVLGAKGEPSVIAIDRYEQAIPQYTVGHRTRVERIRAAIAGSPGLFLTGNYLDGIAVGECVRQGTNAADVAVDFFRRGV